MHPTTYEVLTKSHIADLQPGRSWPEDDSFGERPSPVRRMAAHFLKVGGRPVTILRSALARAAAF